MSKNYILALNGLRFYLFLLILATHYKYIIKVSYIGEKLYPLLNQGHFAVLFFFVLSGFCIALGYHEKFDNLNKSEIFAFIKKRIFKIYPLYIITGLIMLLLYYLPQKFAWLYAFIFLYVPMLAPYTPFPDGGGNGAGWFLSALFLCYILTPFIIKFIKKRNLLICLFLTYLCIIFLALIPVFIPQLQQYSAFIYKFPPIRVFHYSIGLIVGMMYASNSYKLQNNDIIEKHPYLIEVLVLLSIFIIMFGFRHGDISNPILGMPIILITIIYLCNVKNGLLYKLFTNKISQYLGSISFECYMIHYPLCTFLKTKIQPYCYSISGIIVFYFVLLFITIILSVIYNKFFTKILFKTKQ